MEWQELFMKFEKEEDHFENDVDLSMLLLQHLNWNLQKPERRAIFMGVEGEPYRPHALASQPKLYLLILLFQPLFHVKLATVCFAFYLIVLWYALHVSTWQLSLGELKIQLVFLLDLLLNYWYFINLWKPNDGEFASLTLP